MNSNLDIFFSPHTSLSLSGDFTFNDNFRMKFNIRRSTGSNTHWVLMMIRFFFSSHCLNRIIISVITLRSRVCISHLAESLRSKRFMNFIRYIICRTRVRFHLKNIQIKEERETLCRRAAAEFTLPINDPLRARARTRSTCRSDHSSQSVSRIVIMGDLSSFLQPLIRFIAARSR